MPPSALSRIAWLLLFFVSPAFAQDYLSLADRKTRAFAQFGISCEEAAKRLGETNPPVLLDVREGDEFDVSHLRGARHVSFRRFDLKQLADIPTETPIILYCTIGYRSGKISQKLRVAGYADVHNIRGGIIQWFNEGREVVRDGKSVDEIHPYDKYWERFVKKR